MGSIKTKDTLLSGGILQFDYMEVSPTLFVAVFLIIHHQVSQPVLHQDLLLLRVSRLVVFELTEAVAAFEENLEDDGSFEG